MWTALNYNEQWNKRRRKTLHGWNIWIWNSLEFALDQQETLLVRSQSDDMLLHTANTHSTMQIVVVFYKRECRANKKCWKEVQKAKVFKYGRHINDCSATAFLANHLTSCMRRSWKATIIHTLTRNDGHLHGQEAFHRGSAMQEWSDASPASSVEL